MKKDYLINFAGRDFDCVDFGFEENEPVDVVIRPEDIKISEPEKGQITGKVESIIFKGVHYEIVVSSEGFDWKIHSTLYEEPGREVGLSVIPDDIHIMHKMAEAEK
jgi:spermidine/putrescine transport system ATP-binding protein